MIGGLLLGTRVVDAVAGWLTALGAGMGLVLPSAMNTALGALDAERTGTGSALVQALRQAGGTIGVALLGTLLNAGYRGALRPLRDPAAESLVQESVSAGVKVAHTTGSTELLEAVNAAFMHGMSSMMWTSALLAGVLTVLPAIVLRPARARGRHHADPRHSNTVHTRELLDAGD
jgi:chromate transport protein ChrA